MCAQFFMIFITLLRVECVGFFVHTCLALALILLLLYATAFIVMNNNVVHVDVSKSMRASVGSERPD